MFKYYFLMETFPILLDLVNMTLLLAHNYYVVFLHGSYCISKCKLFNDCPTPHYPFSHGYSNKHLGMQHMGLKMAYELKENKFKSWTEKISTMRSKLYACHV